MVIVILSAVWAAAAIAPVVMLIVTMGWRLAFQSNIMEA